MSWNMHEFPDPETNRDKPFSLTAAYEWDGEGRMTALTYPSVGGTGARYTASFDAMGRLSNFAGTSATYGVAGEILTLGGETRTYNSLFQMTRQTVSGQMDMQYIYTPGANNGRIAQSIDGITGETVDYTYDVWNRLIKAETEGTAGVQWGQAYTYDGYGNLTDKTATKGSAPTFHTTINPLTNGGPASWGPTQYGGGIDVEWRPKGSTFGGQVFGWGQSVAAKVYDQAGKRVMSWSGPQTGYWFAGTWEFAMYGVGGQRLLTVKCTYTDYVNALGVNCADAGTNMYFGGKLMQSRGVGVVTDRLGSVRANGNGEQFAYYPYGEERTSTPDGREKWGTYTRDGTGTDYADQRYYNVGTGRFNTPDPYQANNGGPGDSAEPASWNRYTYVVGDPINYVDPTGQAYGPTPPDPEPPNPSPIPPTPDPSRRQPPAKKDPPLTTPSLSGPATATQRRLFTNAARTVESKLRKVDSGCAGDFGPDALKTFDEATFTLGVSFASDADGKPTSTPDPNIYASTNVGSQAVTINMVGNFFDISPTPIAGTDLAISHDMGTGLNQTNFDAFVLLDELGHLTGVLGDDRGKNQPLADAFNTKILKDCFGINWQPPQ
jgi:RHS repeat-associated protein